MTHGTTLTQQTTTPLTHLQVSVKDAIRYLRGEEVDLVGEDGTIAMDDADKGHAARREEDTTAMRLINEIMGFIVCPPVL